MSVYVPFIYCRRYFLFKKNCPEDCCPENCQGGTLYFILYGTVYTLGNLLPPLTKERKKKRKFSLLFFTKYVEYGIIKIVIVRRNLRL